MSPGMRALAAFQRTPSISGLPGISFTSFAGLTDPVPRARTRSDFHLLRHPFPGAAASTIGVLAETIAAFWQSFRSAKNAEGSFVFTGFATSQQASGGVPAPNTGYDFADFLLGLPQQTSLQSGTNSYNFRANAFDVYAQDDFRFRPSLSFNLGLRYEYNGPYTEANNQIANLNVASGFTGAQLLVPTGAVLPPSVSAVPSSTRSLINPDRNNFAPRIGIAWKPMKQPLCARDTASNYNLAQYGAIIQNFAFQPPFAVTSTNISSLASPLTLQAVFRPSTPLLPTISLWIPTIGSAMCKSGTRYSAPAPRRPGDEP